MTLSAYRLIWRSAYNKNAAVRERSRTAVNCFVTHLEFTADSTICCKKERLHSSSLLSLSLHTINSLKCREISIVRILQVTHSLNRIIMRKIKLMGNLWVNSWNFRQPQQEKQIRAKEYYADEYSLIYYDEELGINESTGNVIDFVNVYENGGFIQPRTIQHTSQAIHKFYPAFTFHSLRHTHCTRLLEAGLPIKYVQERLGHKNISVTMNIYNHLTQSQAELSKRALEDVFK